MENNLKILLAILDTFHDFSPLDRTKIPDPNATGKKKFRYSYDIINKLKQFYLTLLPNNFGIPDKNNLYFDSFFNINNNSYPNIESKKFKKYLQNYLVQNLKLNGFKLNLINRQIILNFDKIFDVNLNDISTNFHNNLNSMLSDLEKIKLRHLIYFLIKNNNDSKYCIRIIKFLLNYMNMNFINDDLTDLIYDKILLNLSNLFEDNKYLKNITYPITFFDDMSSGIPKIGLFRFKIINLDKRSIDEASVEGLDSYLVDELDRKTNKQLLIDDEHTLAFNIKNNEQVIDILGTKTFFNNKIISEWESISFRILHNFVGRNANDESNNGLFQDTKNICELYDNCVKYINDPNKDLNILDNELIIIHKSLDYIFELINYINEIIKKVKELNIPKEKEEMKNYFKWLGWSDKREKAIINFVKNLKEDSEILEPKLKSYLKTMNSKLSTIENKILIYKETIKIINEYISLINKIEDIKIKLNINSLDTIKEQNSDYELKIAFRFDKNNDYYKGKKLTIQGIYLAFYHYLKKYNIKVIDTNNLFLELYKVYNKYNIDNNNIGLAQGCIAFLLFNSKRFGDWAQVELSKKYYFLLQTKDFFCKMYSLLIGAPIIINGDVIINAEDEKEYEEGEIAKSDDEDINISSDSFFLYNNNVPDEIFSKEYKKQFVIVNNKGKQEEMNRPKIRYTGLRNIETPTLSREYYYKYLQYKLKYLDLKNKIYLSQ